MTLSSLRCVTYRNLLRKDNISFPLHLPSTPSLYTFPPPQGSSEVAQCDHKRRLLCVQKELIEPRDAAVSNKSTLGPYPFL